MPRCCSVYLGVTPLGWLSTWNLSTRGLSEWHSFHVGLFSLLVLSTLNCARFWFCLVGSPSTWDFMYFDSVHSKVCPHDELLTKECVNSWFCLFCILLTFASVYLGLCPFVCLSTWNRSIWKHVHMIFCQLKIVSTISCVNSELCSFLVLSTWDYVHTGLLLIGILSTLHSVHLVLNRFWICLLGSLAKWHFAHVGLYPLLVLSTLGSAKVRFGLLGSQSSWVFVYLESVHLGVWPYDILPT